MTEAMRERREELSNLIERHSTADRSTPCDIPSLSFVRYDRSSEPAHVLYRPAFCLIAQGTKEVFLAEERYVYGPSDYLVTSMNVPVIGKAIIGTPDCPYLSLKLEFTHHEILEVLDQTPDQILAEDKTARALFVGRIDVSILDAVLRLVRLIDQPKDIPYLAPFYKKEIIYRLLQGPFGAALAQTAIEGSNAYRIQDAVDHILRHYDEPLRMEELAEIAQMSLSSFHRNFKEITLMSPLQFQKQLRLQEARRLLLAEAADASEVAYRVGYESASQFSREYSRLFGAPPKADIKRLKANFELENVARA